MKPGFYRLTQTVWNPLLDRDDQHAPTGGWDTENLWVRDTLWVVHGGHLRPHYPSLDLPLTDPAPAAIAPHLEHVEDLED